VWQFEDMSAGKKEKDLLAMAYFPTGLPRQYHRRWRA
jgi:hypothetical protein